MNLTGDAEMDKMLADCIEVRKLKGKEHTVGSTDMLANFRGVAADVGVPMEVAWYVFFNKHVRAITSYIKGGRKVHSEPISGRIMDCIVYLLLFYKMVCEFEREATPKHVTIGFTPEGAVIKPYAGIPGAVTADMPRGTYAEVNCHDD